MLPVHWACGPTAPGSATWPSVSGCGRGLRGGRSGLVRRAGRTAARPSADRRSRCRACGFGGDGSGAAPGQRCDRAAIVPRQRTAGGCGDGIAGWRLPHPAAHLSSPETLGAATMPSSSRLRTEHLSIGYDETTIIADLCVDVLDGHVTAIVGPNACGKSTLLRGLARLLKPSGGQVILDGHDIGNLHTKEVARRLGLLPQTSTAPEGITVADLVSRGRFPHQKVLRQWSRGDEAAVADAMRSTGVSDLAGRLVDELSGGQRQRVWVAMALAQQTPLLLLDEPTTYLDIAHQVELLDLFAMLNREHDRTVVAVLHDLNHACR